MYNSLKKDLQIHVLFILSYVFHSLNFVSLAWLRQSTTSNHPWPSIATWPVASRFLVLVKPGKPVATRLVKPAIFIYRSPRMMPYTPMSIAQNNTLYHFQLNLKLSRVKWLMRSLQSNYYSNFRWNSGSQHVPNYSWLFMYTVHLCSHHSPPRTIHTHVI